MKNDRYSKLRILLKSGEWREADGETTQLILQIAGMEDQKFLEPYDIKIFPCEDLLTIDRLWGEASSSHFGFSVQKKIWEQFGSPVSYDDDYKKFIKAVGWQSGDDFVSYSDFKFSISRSLIGELPSLYRFSVFSFLAQRLINCGTKGIENEEC